MPLTDTVIRNVKPKDKSYKITDGKGLYLLITKSGKYFRWDYRFEGKRKTMALGVYPDVSLKDARETHGDLRRLLARGVDPLALKKAKKEEVKALTTDSFENVAREWFVKKKSSLSEKHKKTIISRLENNIFPWLGTKNIAQISAPMLLEQLRRIESRGAIETAHRVKNICGEIFRYAIAIGKAERDVSADLRGALQTVESKHMPTITEPSLVGGLLRAIDGYKGSLITCCALKLAPLTFLRPGELRHAEWSEINFKEEVWKIPAEKMKKKRPHIVPLSEQALKILSDIKPLTGDGKYVFPCRRTGARPMSENTVNGALRNLGYGKEELCGHGFRAMATTLLYENGWTENLVEKQLAHVERNSVKAAYNHAQYLPERKEMMKWWANYLDELRDGGFEK